MNFTAPRLFLITSILFLAFQSFGQKTLTYDDRSYEPVIKTVLMYPEGNTVQNVLEPAIIELNGRNNLVLEFDDLRTDADYYFVYFVHCNADWKPSKLRPSMFLNQFNGEEIEEFEFSSESKINYVHYRYTLPRFKHSGNYLAIVYRNGKKEDLVLSKRFRIYENKVGLGGNVSRSSLTGKRLENQRVEVTLNYKGLKTNDPAQNFTVTVAQNQRSDRLKTLSPTFINEGDNLIKYQQLGEENEFTGGNEFRSFDISLINFKGRNIEEISFEDNKPQAKVFTDKIQKPAYFQFLDINGRFYNRDLESNIGDITSEYVKVTFELDYPETNEPIYLLGAFNNWEKSESYQLKFDLQTKKYFTSVLLKQGWYDYTYEIESNPIAIDKSFFETENLYEYFVYYRAMGARGDELVGYFRLNYNSRR